MISYEIWSIIREKLSNTNLMSIEFLNWIKYRHYPIVSWTRESPIYGKLAQYFNATSYGKWWLPISIIKQSRLYEGIKVWLTSQKPSTLFTHKDEQSWLLVDIQQAGKCVSRN